MSNKNSRFFETHVGLAGLHLFAKLFAWYTTWLYVLEFHIDWRGFVKHPFVIFSLYINYHPRKKYGTNHYPLITVSLKILNVKLLDTGQKAAALTKAQADSYMKEWLAERETKERLWQEYKERQAA